MDVIGILASGRGTNAEALMRAGKDGSLGAPVGLVLSDRPEAPVLGIAARYGVPARYVDPGRPGARITPEAEAAVVAALREAHVTWIALAGFMRIVGGTILGAFPGRVLNIHPSLLPSFPGLHPQRQALEHGVKVSGCTVHFVDEGVDSGPIVMQRCVPVEVGDTEERLAARILEAEHLLYVEALRLAVSGKIRIEGRRAVRVP